MLNHQLSSLDNASIERVKHMFQRFLRSKILTRIGLMTAISLTYTMNVADAYNGNHPDIKGCWCLDRHKAECIELDTPSDVSQGSDCWDSCHAKIPLEKDHSGEETMESKKT